MIEKFGYSVIGPRAKNEDYYESARIDDGELFCVADGVGGNSCGGFASKFSVKTFIEDVRSSINDTTNFKDILINVHEKLINEAFSRPKCKGMATTFIGLFLKRNYAYVVHTGDSRLYLLRGNGLKQLTQDQTEAQRLINEGLLTFSTALSYPRRNILDSALGIDRMPAISYFSFMCNSSDRLIISTDGFYDAFSKVELRDLSISNKKFGEFCQRINGLLNEKKLKDNATYLSIEINP